MIELENKDYEKEDSEDDKEIKMDDIESINTKNNNNIFFTSSKNIKKINISDDEFPFNDKSYDSDDASFEAKKKIIIIKKWVKAV